MADPVTRLILRTRARQEADMVTSTFVTDAEINDWINVHIAELYDRLVESGDPDYYSLSSTVTVIPGTTAYTLPSDFRSLTAVYEVSGSRKREIQPIRPGRMADYDVPRGGTVSLEYVPAPPTLSTDTDAVTGTLDAISGWAALVVALTARDMLAREETDVSYQMAKIAELRARIKSHAGKRYAGPRYVTDVTASEDSLSSLAFRLRAGTIELYSAGVGGI